MNRKKTNVDVIKVISTFIAEKLICFITKAIFCNNKDVVTTRTARFCMLSKC